MKKDKNEAGEKETKWRRKNKGIQRRNKIERVRYKDKKQANK
jgi:hypothetical protein